MLGDVFYHGSIVKVGIRASLLVLRSGKKAYEIGGELIRWSDRNLEVRRDCGVFQQHVPRDITTYKEEKVHFRDGPFVVVV